MRGKSIFSSKRNNNLSKHSIVQDVKIISETLRYRKMVNIVGCKLHVIRNMSYLEDFLSLYQCLKNVPGIYSKNKIELTVEINKAAR